MAIYKAEAIVIRSLVYGEADSILTLLTKEEGKVSAIARGVRKPSSRLRGAVQLFSHTQLVLYTGRSLDHLSQGEAAETFPYLESSVESLTAASYCAELVDRLTGERQPVAEVFHLLLAALRSLRDCDPRLLVPVFEIQLLAILGYRPRLDACVVGEHPLPDGGPFWFSVERGGIVCRECARNCPGAVPLLPSTAGALDYFLRTPLAKASRVKLDRRSLRELSSLLRSYLVYHCEVKLRSWKFDDALRG